MTRKEVTQKLTIEITLADGRRVSYATTIETPATPTFPKMEIGRQRKQAPDGTPQPCGPDPGGPARRG